MDTKNLGNGDEGQWNGIEDTIEDPEELRVIFCALDSFSQYAKTAHLNCTHFRRQAFYALPQAHWQMLAAPPFSYLKTLDRVDEAIESNAALARTIVRYGLQSFGVIDAAEQPGDPRKQVPEPATVPAEWAGIAKHQDLDKARSTIRQFYRDWSAEGAVERDACYGPVYRALDAEKARRRRLRQEKKQQQQQQRQQRQNQQQEEQQEVKEESEKPMKILVPGAGLGRLVFELCRRGFPTEGNEISYHQLLGSSYILNYSERAGQHTIYPWIHTFSNHRSRESQFRCYQVPDVHPQSALQVQTQDRAVQQQARRQQQQQGEGEGEKGEEKEGDGDGDGDSADATTIGPIGSMQMCAADFLCLYGDDEHAGAYDAVAAVFFLDTAPNLIRYLQVILRCLRPGGLLINVGPLLWHWENHVQGHPDGYDGSDERDNDDDLGIADPGSFELTDDEVMALVEQVGFVVEMRETDKEAPYVQDPDSMLRTVYRASHWVARKPET